MKFPSNLLQVTIPPGIELLHMRNGVGGNGPSSPHLSESLHLVLIGIRFNKVPGHCYAVARVLWTVVRVLLYGC